MSTINILIPVHIPDWWRDLAIERYRKHASNGTRLVGTMPDEGEAVGTTEELARVLTRKGKDHARFLYAARTRGDQRFLAFAPRTARVLARAARRAAPLDACIARLAELLAGWEGA